MKSVDSQRRTTAAISKWVLRLRSIIKGKFDTYFRLLWSFQVTLQFNSNAERFYWFTIGLYRFSFTYLHINMYILTENFLIDIPTYVFFIIDLARTFLSHNGSEPTRLPDFLSSYGHIDWYYILTFFYKLLLNYKYLSHEMKQIPLKP